MQIHLSFCLISERNYCEQLNLFLSRGLDQYPLQHNLTLKLPLHQSPLDRWFISGPQPALG